MSTFVINYTPHTVTLLRANDSAEMVFESRGTARCAESLERIDPLDWDPFGDGGMLCHLPRVRRSFGEVSGLPAPQAGVAYIVSQLVQDALPDRTDLMVPAEVVRDESGRIVGCKSFAVR
jgi:hypothetical protein